MKKKVTVNYAKITDTMGRGVKAWAMVDGVPVIYTGSSRKTAKEALIKLLEVALDTGEVKSEEIEVEI